MVIGWSFPRRVRRSRENRARLEKQTEHELQRVAQSAAAASRSADRLERAAAALMERHDQALIDAARELRRK